MSAAWAAILAALLASCASPVPAGSSIGDGPHTVASPLESFWSAHGGLATFGPPLEDARIEGSLLRQMFLNAEIVLDPSLPEGERVYLAPLGLQLGLAEPPIPIPEAGDAGYYEITGHLVYPGFASFFARIGGASLTGPPIAEVRFRDGWVVQAFLNLGLARPESAAPSEVRFLSYGIAARPELASTAAPDASLLPPGLRPRPFAAVVDRLGGEAVIGPPLTDPYLAGDGSLEQVYQRAVLYSPSDSPSQVRLRPLGSGLGPADPAVLDAAEGFDLYVPQTGHNIAWAFAEFYHAHGGSDLLGLPLEEAKLTEEVLRQRFESVVLEYHFELPPLLAVQLAPLGGAYLLQLPAETIARLTAPTAQPLPQGTRGAEQTYAVWLQTSSPVLRVGAPQIITVHVTRADGSPVPELTPLLVIHVSSGDLFPAMVPTDGTGTSSVEVQISDLHPGEVVNFEVFLAAGDGVGYALGQFAVGASSSAP